MQKPIVKRSAKWGLAPTSSRLKDSHLPHLHISHGVPLFRIPKVALVAASFDPRIYAINRDFENLPENNNSVDKPTPRCPLSSALESPVSSEDVPQHPTAPEVSLFRLYTLRLCYFILAAGLGTYVWPLIIQHTSDFAIAEGVRFALLGGLGATAVLGFRYPLQMLPLLLFELIWKAIYLVAFALPLWSAHQITQDASEDIKSVLMVVIFIPLIPWRYVFRHYVMKSGDRWR